MKCDIVTCPSCKGRAKRWYNRQKGRILKTKPKNFDFGFIYYELICNHCMGNGLVNKNKVIKGYNIFHRTGSTLNYKG